jgi:UDP-glucose 4-epimerase
MRVFVTGGAGFIGSHLVDSLVEEGHEVVVYDDLSTGDLKNIKYQIDNNNVRFIRADLLNLPYLIESMAGSEMVFHLAAHSDIRRGIENTKADLENETIGTYNILESMRLNQIKRIVFSSSATIYGDTQAPVNEEHGPLLPISLYGAGKLAGEGLISAFCHLFGMQSWVNRFTNIIGSRGNHGVIFDFAHKLRNNTGELEILGNGSQFRPFLHVRECVDGIIFGFKHAHETVNLLNIGVDSTTDVNTVARIVVKEMGLTEVQFKYTGGNRGWNGDAPYLNFDTTKLKKLGWQAKLSSDEAVVRAAREIIEEMN